MLNEEYHKHDETNRLIAEFMELETVVRHPRTGEWTEAHFDFHHSWDCLMPVVERIEVTHHTNLMAKPNGFIFLITTGNIDAPISIRYFKGSPGHKNTATTKIEAVYNATVDFIKWYNENRQQ